MLKEVPDREYDPAISYGRIVVQVYIPPTIYSPIHPFQRSSGGLVTSLIHPVIQFAIAGMDWGIEQGYRLEKPRRMEW